MQPNQAELQEKINLRMRTMRTLWFAICLSVVINYVMTAFAWHRNEQAVENNLLSLGLVAAGLIATLVAVFVKQRFLTQSVDQQSVVLVQQGYVMAWGITEVAAIRGLLDFFLTSNRYYYVLFIVAICGQLWNFPRRQHVLDASFRGPMF